MVLTGLNQFKPGKIDVMPASGINSFNFSRFKPGGLNHLPTLMLRSLGMGVFVFRLFRSVCGRGQAHRSTVRVGASGGPSAGRDGTGRDRLTVGLGRWRWVGDGGDGAAGTGFPVTTPTRRTADGRPTQPAARPVSHVYYPGRDAGAPYRERGDWPERSMAYVIKRDTAGSAQTKVRSGIILTVGARPGSWVS